MKGAEPGSARAAALSSYRRGDADAAGLLADALVLNPLDGGLLIADATSALEDGRADALDRLTAAVRVAPDWLDGHVALARLRWGRGEHEAHLDALREALGLLPRHAGLWMRLMSLLAEAGEHGEAADVAARLRGAGDVPALRLLEARFAGLAGDRARAAALLASLPSDDPDADEERARHLLRGGDIGAALPLLDGARTAAPDDVRLWALTELAWRAGDDPRHDWLMRPELIGSGDLGLNDSARDRLSQRLRTVHDRRWPPLGQSVRGGTQTRGNLRDRADPDVTRLFMVLDRIVADYWASLPPHDPGHPLLKHRDEQAWISSSWSVRLANGGHHVSHVHPGGVLSSAVHLSVPADRPPDQGLLELGRPPADLPPLGDPLVTVAPNAGRVTLFPSFLYHGTSPLEVGERLSVAFDVAVAPRAAC